jgi:hypothetical protein
VTETEEANVNVSENSGPQFENGSWFESHNGHDAVVFSVGKTGFERLEVLTTTQNKPK